MMRDAGCAIRVSAPGSLMLLGEHAVLHGRRALVCAINKRIAVTLSALDGPVLRIQSALGEYEEPLELLSDHPDFRFVLDAVKQYPLEQGIELTIESEFPADIGFGSSAAVTAATHAALMQILRGQPVHCNIQRGENVTMYGLTPHEVFKRSLATIRRVQGRGSGADVAASVFGGVIAYRADPLEMKRVGSERIISDDRSDSPSIHFPLTAVYSGSKMKTADVIRLVEERRKADPEKYERIFSEMDASVGAVLSDFSCLGEMLTKNQKLMEEMGLCNDALADIIAEFRRLGVPAKISGSGLGDCAVGLGRFPNSGKFRTFPLQIALQGVCG